MRLKVRPLERLLMGREDGSVGKMLAVRMQGPEFDPSEPMGKSHGTLSGVPRVLRRQKKAAFWTYWATV